MLQVLRAVAALLVAQAHVIDVSVQNHRPAFQNSFGHFENFGAVGVDLFFVVSGFIVPLTALGATVSRTRFLLRRVIRIYPLWWCALAGRVIQIRLGHHWCDWHLLLRSALLAPSRNPAYTPIVYLGWSLIFEMFFYLLIVLVWNRTQPIRRLGTVLMAAAVLGVAGALLHPRFPFAHLIANPILLEFCGGIFVGMLWISDRMPSRRAGWALLSVGALSLLCTGYLGFGSISEMQYIVTGELSARRVLEWGVPATLIVLGSLTILPSCTSRIGRGMVLLGDASYSIYLSQFFTQLLIFTVWRYLTAIPADLDIFLGLTVMAGVGLLVHRFIESPLLDLLKPLARTRVRRLESVPALAVDV